MSTTVPARRVLLVCSDPDPQTDVIARLTGAGFDVRRCHRPGEWFPCVGLDTGDCPLEVDGGVDVAVDVRSHPWPDPTTVEVGVTCAVRHDVPLAVVGRRPHPFSRWAAAEADSPADVVAAVEEALRASLEPLRATVAAEVVTVLANHGVEDVTVAVDIDRQREHLQVRIGTDVDVPKAVRTMAVTRAAVAVRRIDERARAIEIDFGS